MLRFFLRHKKVLSILLVIVTATFLITGAVFAQNEPGQNNNATSTTTTQDESSAGLGNIPLPFIGNIMMTLLLIFQFLFGMLIKLAALLVSGALHFNQSILTFDPPFITTGWAVFRDLANLGFVFGIILIAVATILRFKSYTAQSILWKLIVAALLVNFSLVIAGAVIQVSDVFSNYFLEQMTGRTALNASGFVGVKLADQFQIDEALNPRGAKDENGNILKTIAIAGLELVGQDEIAAAISFGNKVEDLWKNAPGLYEVISAFVVLLIETIAMLTLFAVAVMLFLRYFWLSFLLILSPLVWLLWVFPSTQKHWTTWWKKFIHWVMYAPVMLFFIWLALKVLENAQAYRTLARNAIGDDGGILEKYQGIGNVEFGFLMNTLMAAALLIGGLKAAQSMGHGGTSIALNAATKGGNWAKQQAIIRTRRGAQRVGGGLLASERGKRVQERLTKWGSNKYANIATFGLAGATARGVSRAQTSMQKGAQGPIEDFKKSLKDMNPKEIARLLPTMSTEKRAAALEQLSEKGKLSELGEKFGNTKAMLASVKQMKKLGRNKEAGDIEKKMGMNEEMMETAEKIKGTQDPEQRQALEKEYQKQAEKFYEGFSQQDWQGLAKTMAKELFATNDDGSVKENILGLGEETTKIYREQYVSGLTGDLGRALHKTTPELNTSSLKTLYRTLILTNAENIPTAQTSAGTGTVLDASGKPISQTTTTQADLTKLIEDAEQTGNYSPVIDLMKKSTDRKTRAVAEKMSKGMAGMFATEDKKDKKEDKKEDKPKDTK
jgi:hypothetical protein